MSERLLHLTVLSHYVFSLYTVLYVDEKRKDFVVMVAHHVLTLYLVTISYTAR